MLRMMEMFSESLACISGKGVLYQRGRRARLSGRGGFHDSRLQVAG